MFKKKGKKDEKAGKKRGFVLFKKGGDKDKDSDSKPYDVSRKGEKHRPSAKVQADALRSMKD